MLQKEHFGPPDHYDKHRCQYQALKNRKLEELTRMWSWNQDIFLYKYFWVPVSVLTIHLFFTKVEYRIYVYKSMGLHALKWTWVLQVSPSPSHIWRCLINVLHSMATKELAFEMRVFCGLFDDWLAAKALILLFRIYCRKPYNGT